MEFDKKSLKESTRMKLQSCCIFPRFEISEEQGLILLVEIPMKEPHSVWQPFHGATGGDQYVRTPK